MKTDDISHLFFCVFNFVPLQLKMNDIPITLYKGFYRLFLRCYGLLLVHGLIQSFMGLVWYDLDFIRLLIGRR